MANIDLYSFITYSDGCALVIGAKTGVFYTAQCGGTSCTHPSQEGYYLPMWDIAKDIDECEFGCSNLTKTPRLDHPELRKNLADAIQKHCKIEKRYSFSLRFDYSRIDELQEGWWPMLISGMLHDVNFDCHPCIYHRGNCD